MKQGEFLLIKPKSLIPIRYSQENKLSLPHNTINDKQFQQNLLSKQSKSTSCQTSTNIQLMNSFEPNKQGSTSDSKTAQPQRNNTLNMKFKENQETIELQQDSLKQSYLQTQPIDKEHQKNQRIQNKKGNSQKVQPIHFTSMDAKQAIPKEAKKIQNDSRNKSIAYLQNIFQKNLLKQQKQLQQNNEENLPILSNNVKSNLENYRILNNEKLINIANNQKNQDDELGSNIQKQSSFEEDDKRNTRQQLMTSCKTTRENTLNQQSQKDKPNKQSNSQIMKNLISEYFTCNNHKENHLQNSFQDYSQTDREKLCMDQSNSYTLTNILIEENDDNQTIKKAKNRYQRHPVSLEKYDSTKFENELRQKYNLQTLDLDEQKIKVANFLQSSINHQSQVYKQPFKIVKNSTNLFSPKQYQNLENSCQKLTSESLPSKVSKTLPTFTINSKFSNQNENIELQKLSRWNEEFTFENKITSIDKNYLQEVKERKQQLLNFGIKDQRKQQSQIKQCISLCKQINSLEQEFSVKINKHLKGKGNFDQNKLFRNTYNKVPIDHIEQATREPLQISFDPYLNQEELRGKHSNINSRSQFQNKIKFFNYNQLNNKQNLQQSEMIALTPLKKQSSMSEIFQIKKINRNTNNKIQDFYNHSDIFTVESYDIENYIKEQRHIK